VKFAEILTHVLKGVATGREKLDDLPEDARSVAIILTIAVGVFAIIVLTAIVLALINFIGTYMLPIAVLVLLFIFRKPVVAFVKGLAK